MQKKVRQKLNNKTFLKTLIIPAAVMIFTALPAFCAPEVTIKQAAVKFLLAMGGVALSSIIIYAGLTIYNKIFVRKKSITFNQEDSLSTPDNIDDAVDFFIKKNKLR